VAITFSVSLPLQGIMPGWLHVGRQCTVQPDGHACK